MLGRIVISPNNLRLLRILTKHPPPIQIGFAARRQFHLDLRRHKWLSKEEAKLIAEVAVGSRGGHPEDPEKNTNDTPYYGHPDKGDVIPKSK